MRNLHLVAIHKVVKYSDFCIHMMNLNKKKSNSALKAVLNHGLGCILNGLSAGRLSLWKFLGDPVSLCNLSWEGKWLAERLHSADSLSQNSV